jgi:predicted metalloprotease
VVAQRRSIARVTSLLAGSLLVASCGITDVQTRVAAVDSAPIVADGPVGPGDFTPSDPDPGEGRIDDPGTDTPLVPDDAMGDDQVDMPEIDPADVDPTAIDFGPGKDERLYDDFLLASLADIERWLEADFEPAFGIPYLPLEGGVYAGYPGRTDIPGCGEPSTAYELLQRAVAFYCPVGDFIAYDDGEQSLLTELAAQFGPATIGIVLAHEYGHALQQRDGTLQQRLATVTTEQQADCISGAWAARAAAGLAPGVPFTDNDVRAGLIAMIRVQDPVGVDPTTQGGHGSGFDRVGAFQTGFIEGLDRCAQLIDDPLPLTPLAFLTGDDQINQGNAPFGFGENQLFNFLLPDLNTYWDVEVDSLFPNFQPLETVAVSSIDQVDCGEPRGYAVFGVELCSATNTVFIIEPIMRQVYDERGDFGPGFLLGIVWAEQAQTSNRSQVTGEARQLRNDCLVGAWVDTLIPDPTTRQLPQPRAEGRTSSVSPGDLTEAILTAIVIGDRNSESNVLGSAFEKVDEFRRGALGGISACM